MIGWVIHSYYDYQFFGLSTWLAIVYDLIETLLFYLLFERDEYFRSELRKEARYVVRGLV
jgi:hypothetical protein